MKASSRSEEHTSELQSHSDLHSFPTRRSSDLAGHTGIVSKGGAQWMTSGRGIIHAERPLAENEGELTMHGIQLWTSLPRALKTMEPRYQRIAAENIPAAQVEGASVRV